MMAASYAVLALHMASHPLARRVVAAIPNALTVMRLAVAVLFPLLGPAARLPALLAAALSDVLDGYLARRLGATSWTGALLDAAADKLLALVVLATFAVEGLVLLWQVPLLLARDLAVGAIYALVALRREWWVFRKIRPRLAGKLTTLAVLTLVIAILAWPAAARVLFWPAAAVNVWAGIDYLIVFTRAHRRHYGQTSSHQPSAADPSDASRCAP
jgi:cardiolipin synthase (CMP-forming)